jgi:hypothetical protein
MSLRKLGKATIKVNGTVYQSYPGASVDIGGPVRTTRVGHDVHGFSESTRQGSLEFDMDLGVGTSLDELRQVEDATVVFECDTGQVFVGNHWWITEPPTFTDGDDSKVKVKMEGAPMEEMG